MNDLQLIHSQNMVLWGHIVPFEMLLNNQLAIQNFAKNCIINESQILAEGSGNMINKLTVFFYCT